MRLVSFWYWRWFNSLFSLHSAIFCLWYWDWVASLFFHDSEDSFAHFFSLFRCCWASLFSLDSLLLFTLLHFSYSCLAINRCSFSSGISFQDFCFLFICYVWFLLFLKGKCSIFGLLWTFCKSSSLSETKTPLISKETNPICKQEMFKYDTRFSIPSMVSKVHFPNEWGIPSKSLEWASKKALFWILNHCNSI